MSIKASSQNSVATQLIRIVFSVYCLVAVLVTAFHIYTEYQYTREQIYAELITNESIFGPVLASSLWDLDTVQIQTVLEGMLKIPVIIGVEIKQHDEVLARVGKVPAAGRHYVQLESGPQVKQKHTLSRREGNGAISYEFPIVYEYNNTQKSIGRAIIYSDTSVIMDRIGLGFVMLVVNAIIKTAALWIIFMWAGKRILIRPLSKLTHAIEQVDLDSLDRFEIDLDVNYENELTVIEDKFEAMVVKLYQSKQRIDHFNRDLECQVKLRTEELESAKELAESADRAKTVFLSRMSHELRTPLNAIIGFSRRQVRIADKGKPEQMLDMAQTILKAGNHLLMLINDIISYVESEQGSLSVSLARYSLAQIVSDSLIFVEDLARKNNISLIDETEDFDVQTDPGRLTQVVINLLSNAIKYNRPQGSVVVRSRYDHVNQKVWLSVTDTGVGISEPEREKVFEPFTRLEYAEYKAIEGTGIGLALCQFLVNEMNGDIELDSDVGVGSTFSISMPAASSD